MQAFDRRIEVIEARVCYLSGDLGSETTGAEGFVDQPLIDRLAKTEGGHVGQMIEQIVLSPQFREIRGRDSAGTR